MQRLPFQALSCSLEDRKAVTSKSRLRYKLRFHHISRFDLNYKYLVQKIAIWFETRFDIFAIRLEKDSNHDKPAACLLTDTNWNVRIIETLTHSMQFDAETAPYYLTDWHCMCIVTLQTISCVIRPKIYHVKYHNLDFLFKIYLHTRFCEGFEI